MVTLKRQRLRNKQARTTDLTRVDTHFAFGENWKEFVKGVDRTAVDEAVAGLRKLLPANELAGKSFFDIGCGSGLHMIAAAELGASRVEGIDIDPDSVEAAQSLLSRFLRTMDWSARERSVFDLNAADDGLHDVVYSWGVLHHSGDVWGAVANAAKLVAPGGTFAIALYRRTPACGVWTRIKRRYASSGPLQQAVMRGIYKAVYLLGLTATGRNPVRYVRSYRSNRGMSWHHDLHDWLGGYPYEPVEPQEVAGVLDRLGFNIVRSFTRPGAALGLLGTHCDEYVAVRRP